MIVGRRFPAVVITVSHSACLMVIARGAHGRCMGLDRGRRRSVVSNGTLYLDGLAMDIFVSAGMVRASLVECGPRMSSVVAVEVG